VVESALCVKPPLVPDETPVPPTANPSATLRLRVTATAESIIRAKHPWLFEDSIRKLNREGRAGDLAVIYDRKDAFLGIGLYDPDSPIRVRMLHAGKPCKLDDAWWSEHLRQALARREGMCDAQTTGCRLIHGESDGWPGLVVDRYDTTLVLKLYTAAWLPRWRDVAGKLWLSQQPERLVLRLSRNMQDKAEKDFGVRDGQVMKWEPDGTARVDAAWLKETSGTVLFQESGIRFEANVVSGQKTGFFLDQRENRRRVGALSAGRDVLNAFSFSGGFSLYAAQGGAKSVTDLDISAHALASAGRNYALNQSLPGVAQCMHETVQGDAFAWLANESQRKFDLIVLDPPSLAKRETEREGAIAAYGALALSGMRLLRPGGVLVAASCSAHVTAVEFFHAVRRAAKESGRRFEELDTTGHPPDHPATFKEGLYLKCIYLRFEGSGTQ
jgi:23S rRNA (cytosine1962-C5)-methyltransferase